MSDWRIYDRDARNVYVAIAQTQSFSLCAKLTTDRQCHVQESYLERYMSSDICDPSQGGPEIRVRIRKMQSRDSRHREQFHVDGLSLSRSRSKKRYTKKSYRACVATGSLERSWAASATQVPRGACTSDVAQSKPAPCTPCMAIHGHGARTWDNTTSPIQCM